MSVQGSELLWVVVGFSIIYLRGAYNHYEYSLRNLSPKVSAIAMDTSSIRC